MGPQSAECAVAFCDAGSADDAWRVAISISSRGADWHSAVFLPDYPLLYPVSVLSVVLPGSRQSHHPSQPLACVRLSVQRGGRRRLVAEHFLCTEALVGRHCGLATSFDLPD